MKGRKRRIQFNGLFKKKNLPDLGYWVSENLFPGLEKNLAPSDFPEGNFLQGPRWDPFSVFRKG